MKLTSALCPSLQPNFCEREAVAQLPWMLCPSPFLPPWSPGLGHSLEAGVSYGAWQRLSRGWGAAGHLCTTWMMGPWAGLARPVDESSQLGGPGPLPDVALPSCVNNWGDPSYLAFPSPSGGSGLPIANHVPCSLFLFRPKASKCLMGYKNVCEGCV